MILNLRKIKPSVKPITLSLSNKAKRDAVRATKSSMKSKNNGSMKISIPLLSSQNCQVKTLGDMPVADAKLKIEHVHRPQRRDLTDVSNLGILNKSKSTASSGSLEHMLMCSPMTTSGMISDQDSACTANFMGNLANTHKSNIIVNKFE